MEKTTGRVLKADDVRVQGQFHLDIGEPSNRPGRVSNPVSSSPRVCIVENNPNFAIIEITCSCGTKTQVRCEYSETKEN